MSNRLTGDMLDEVFDTIVINIKKNKHFTYSEFGAFKVKNRKSRTDQNPQTGAEIQIKASKAVGFKPSPKFKNSL